MQPDSPQPATLPPPLALLHDTPAGALYGITIKSILFEGLEGCQHGAVTGAEWHDEGRILTLRLQSGPRITFTASGPRLLDPMQLPGLGAGTAMLPRGDLLGAPEACRFAGEFRRVPFQRPAAA